MQHESRPRSNPHPKPSPTGKERLTEFKHQSAARTENLDLAQLDGVAERCADRHEFARHRLEALDRRVVEVSELVETVAQVVGAAVLVVTNVNLHVVEHIDTCKEKKSSL